MKKFLVLAAFVLLVLCVSSCSPDEFQKAGKISISLGNNVIGATKEYKEEKKNLDIASNALVEDIASSQKPSISNVESSTLESMISSINSFTSAPTVGESRKETDTGTGMDFVYEKKVDFSKTDIGGSLELEEKTELIDNIKSILGTSSEKKGITTTATSDTVLQTIEKANKLVSEFGAMKKYEDDAVIQKIVALAKQCMKGAENAVLTVLAHMNEGNISLEDIVVTTLANQVNNQYGVFADGKHNGSGILNEISSATCYFDALINLGIIPKFQINSVITEFFETH